MKIRNFTAEETDQLLQKFVNVAESTVQLHTKAYNLMQEKYEYYKSNFKHTLFSRKVLTFDDFVNNISIDTSRFYIYFRPYTKHRSTFDIKPFFDDLFNDAFFYFRGYVSEWVYDREQFTKNSDVKLSEDDIELLIEVTELYNMFFNNSRLQEWYMKLKKYAQRPFEFHESDIEYIEDVEYLYKKYFLR